MVGAATVEIEARDSFTNDRLAAAVDSRAGNKALSRAFSKWADVREAANFWAEGVRDFLVRQGVAQRAGVSVGLPRRVVLDNLKAAVTHVSAVLVVDLSAETAIGSAAGPDEHGAGGESCGGCP